MEVKPGFKQTEVGVIPTEWDAASIGQFSTCFSGGTPSTSNPRYYGGDIPWITSSDLNRRRVSEVAGRITDDGLANSAAKFVTQGTLLMALYGATAGVCAISEIRAAINQAVFAIVPHGVITEFLFQTLTLRKDHFIKAYTQGGQPNLSGEIVKSFSIPIPPLPEQHVIAATLSDVDALLDRLYRLIAKKRDLKQAAMQQLLTGRTRLPGFQGEWEVKRLGDHVAFLRNGTNSRAELTQDDPVKYLHYGDVHASVGTQLRPNALPSLPSEKAKSLARLQDGDLVFADASEDLAGVSKSVEMRGVARAETVPGLHTIAARFDKSVLSDGFKSYLQFCPTFSGQLRRLAAGTKVYATNRAHIASIEMRLPGVDEQTTIATALSDMDAELSALEARLDKTRDLKRGMMQELLTGRIRFI